MRSAFHTALRIPVAILFLLSMTGVPLYEHVCGMLGTAEIFSSCTMHDAKQPAPESCCSGHASDLERERLSARGTGVGECCSEVEVTKQVTDSFTAAHGQPNLHILASAAPLPAVILSAEPDSPVLSSSFCSDPSPPPRDGTYILLSSLLI